MREALVEQYGPQPAGRVISLLRQACDSLEEAHDAGWSIATSSRATCSSAAWASSADFVKVLDFGLVKALTGREPDPAHHQARRAELRPSCRRNRCAGKPISTPRRHLRARLRSLLTC